MVRGKLTARRVETAKPGKHEDGHGLRLVVTASGARKWVLRYMRRGKRTEMGLGSAFDVSLAEARKKAATARKQLADGVDPLAEARKAKAGTMTFRQAADALIESMGPSWRNAKHRAQWEMTLREYCKPLAGMAVADVSTADVLRVLKPIWQKKPETASRLRGRIERVLDYAKAHHMRDADNPARWRGHLDAILPKRQKLMRGHHKALPFADLPDFFVTLRTLGGVAPLALEFLILTAARSGEALGARWSEFDLENKIWTVPAHRMKAAREHRVPLSDRAAAIVAEHAKVRTGEFVFPGNKPGKPLSNMALAMTLRRMEAGVTAHGFRSSFRDWAGERTVFPRDVAEAALAHRVGDATERAYRRGDALEKRRELMTAWASFCEPKAENVVTFAPRKA